MPSVIATIPKFQFSNSIGFPLVNGTLTVYSAGTVTPISTWQDSALTVLNTNPIVLDSRGECVIWLDASLVYKFVLKDAFGTTQWTVDNISGGGSYAYILEALLAASTGAAKVGFLQSGASAVARTLQDKSREIVSVKDFGAKGDGITDDTAAIQAAINYTISQRFATLYFPPNNPAQGYKVTAPLIIANSINIVGAGQRAVTILAVGFTAGQAVLNYDCLAIDTVYHSLLQGLTILSTNNLPNGIRISNMSYLLIKQVQLYSLFRGIEITGTQTFSNFFEEVTFYLITDRSVNFSNFTGGGQYMFTGCTFTGSIGLVIDSTAATDSLTLINCNFERCVSNDMYVSGTVIGLLIHGCRSEGLTGLQSIFLEPALGKIVSGISITGCNWASNAGNAYPVYLSGSGKIKGFNISGNSTGYAGFLGFVFLNANGDAGVISGNWCENCPTTKVVNTPRIGVSAFNNFNTAGALTDYLGTSIFFETGTFTLTVLTGLTTTPSALVSYSVSGKVVTLDIPGGLAGTSNLAGFTFGGIPINARPTSDKDHILRVINNGTVTVGFIRIQTNGQVSVFADVAGNGFIASGAKSTLPVSLTYTLV